MYGPNDHDSDEDNEEFEEVDILASRNDKKKGKQPKRNTQPSQPKKPRNAVFAMQGEDILKDDPTYAGGTRVVSRRQEQESIEDSSRATSEVSTPPIDDADATRQELLARAPVVPWDDDLAVWDKKEMAFNTSGLERSHRFLGVGDGSNMVSDATLERMKMRTRIYSPQLPKVIKACRYPMSNGRLCMRRDLVRCPYHGPIVPRDEYGQIQRLTEDGRYVPVEEEDKGLDDAQEAALIDRAIAAASGSSSSLRSSATRSTSKAIIKDQSSWEDIEDDVHLALGLEKIEPKRKRGQGGSNENKKKNKKPASALVNITKPPESSRARLLRHVGSKSSRDSVEQDRQMEKTSQSKDTRLNRWR
ncbi:hypothetical protein BX616_002433 [Lobosporangium transversale]|nr:hypothetical protein BX616_002433 [Lobosporangium transversale]